MACRGNGAPLWVIAYDHQDATVNVNNLLFSLTNTIISSAWMICEFHSNFIRCQIDNLFVFYEFLVNIKMQTILSVPVRDKFQIGHLLTKLNLIYVTDALNRGF